MIWHPLPDPVGGGVPTRRQVERSTPFNRGEGIACRDGSVYFATAGDNRVWTCDAPSARLCVLYAAGDGAMLRGVDNVVVGPADEVLVAQDGDDMQPVAPGADRQPFPIVQVVGHPSEVTGPSFTDAGRRLYFSSQRGRDYDPRPGTSPFLGGVTYEWWLPPGDDRGAGVAAWPCGRAASALGCSLPCVGRT